jgi:ABC-2 type transport system ATP-binding protein
MAQKFNLLCVCCINPIAHFDEPWFWPCECIIIKDEILALRDQGATIIFSTHRMESVGKCAIILHWFTTK